jgi:hypothetical protein
MGGVRVDGRSSRPWRTETGSRVFVMSTSMLSKAVSEVRAGIEPSDRLRVAGGGDRPAIDKQPGLLAALGALVYPDSREDLMLPLR